MATGLPLNYVIENIPASVNGSTGVVNVDYAGGFLMVMASSDNFQIQFDSGSPFVVKAGFQFRQNYGKVTLYNLTSNPVAVSLATGDASVSYVGSNFQVEAQSYSKGNLGCNSATTLAALTGGFLSSTVTLVNRGTGYVVGDIVTIAGGTFTTAAQYKVVTVNNSTGAVVAIVQSNRGLYSVFPASPNTPTGGTGTGLQLGLTNSSGTGSFTYDATRNALVLDSAATGTVNNFDGSNRRKQIFFTVLNTGTSGAPSSSLILMDTNSNFFMLIAPGQQIGMSCSSQFILKGLGEGTVTTTTFIIGENYYSP